MKKYWLNAGIGLALVAPLPTIADMNYHPLLTSAMIEQLEVGKSGDETPLVWEAKGWLGKDLNKLWLKTEGEHADGSTQEAELQLLYGRAIATNWDVQIGWRNEPRPSPARNWLAIGLQGLAPYHFETEAELFVRDGGHAIARLELEYELLLTQRWILTPEMELTARSKSDPQVGAGSGLSDLELGLRLRYEIRREFAPYVGVTWEKQFGARGEDSSEVRWLLGIRAWF